MYYDACDVDISSGVPLFSIELHWLRDVNQTTDLAIPVCPASKLFMRRDAYTATVATALHLYSSLTRVRDKGHTRLPFSPARILRDFALFRRASTFSLVFENRIGFAIHSRRICARYFHEPSSSANAHVDFSWLVRLFNRGSFNNLVILVKSPGFTLGPRREKCSPKISAERYLAPAIRRCFRRIHYNPFTCRECCALSRSLSLFFNAVFHSLYSVPFCGETSASAVQFRCIGIAQVATLTGENEKPHGCTKLGFPKRIHLGRGVKRHKSRKNTRARPQRVISIRARSDLSIAAKRTPLADGSSREDAGGCETRVRGYKLRCVYNLGNFLRTSSTSEEDPEKRQHRRKVPVSFFDAGVHVNRKLRNRSISPAVFMYIHMYDSNVYIMALSLRDYHLAIYILIP